MKKITVKAIILLLCIASALCLASCENTQGEQLSSSEHTHSEQIVPAIPKTCTENGYTEGKKCADCGEILVEPTLILASHNEKIFPRVEPDINQTGYTEGKECIDCGEVFVERTEITLISMAIDGEKSQRGQISCQITVSNKLSGELRLYYANKEKQRLPHYNDVATIPSTESGVTLDSIVLPSDCEYIMATNGGDYDYFVKIPTEYTQGKVDYTFGSLSDVHTNDGKYFEGALDFFDEYGEIDFVAISGDISDGADKDLDFFNNTIKDRDYKVYTTTGNHDSTSVGNGKWLEKINTANKTDEEVSDIADNGLDFVYAPSENEDCVFVFFCQTSWNYPKKPTGKEYSIVTAEQLDWLAGVLEKYKDKTVFLYFHTFLSGPGGRQENAVGNLRNPGGYAYDLPFSYGAGDEMRFRALLKEYKNVVFFSGHSHWMFELEKYNPNLNVSNFNGDYCYMVHNPSVCTPRWIEENSPSRENMKGKYSEGWIVEVHEDSLTLIPVDFISQTFYTEYMKLIPIN